MLFWGKMSHNYDEIIIELEKDAHQRGHYFRQLKRNRQRKSAYLLSRLTLGRLSLTIFSY